VFPRSTLRAARDHFRNRQIVAAMSVAKVATVIA
jgi:hypothetical protein